MVVRSNHEAKDTTMNKEFMLRGVKEFSHVD
jgi:hypothetical protein